MVNEPKGMTQDGILNATPEQLRLWVATELFGWTHISHVWCGYPESGPVGDNKPVPPKWPGRLGAILVPDYPADIATAWPVVEKMREWGWRYKLLDDEDTKDHAVFHRFGSPIGYHAGGFAPEAICKAALLATLEVSGDVGC